MTEPQNFNFLPTIPSMPTPPEDNGNIEEWQKHIMAIDKYILDLNAIIGGIKNNDFARNLKQKIENLGLDLDNINLLPEVARKEIVEKINNLINSFKVSTRELEVKAGKQQPPNMIQTQRNITKV